MPLGWNEIKSRAVAFSKEWELESNEDGEAKSFGMISLMCLEYHAEELPHLNNG